MTINITNNYNSTGGGTIGTSSVTHDREPITSFVTSTQSYTDRYDALFWFDVTTGNGGHYQYDHIEVTLEPNLDELITFPVTSVIWQQFSQHDDYHYTYLPNQENMERFRLLMKGNTGEDVLIGGSSFTADYTTGTGGSQRLNIIGITGVRHSAIQTDYEKSWAHTINRINFNNDADPFYEVELRPYSEKTDLCTIEVYSDRLRTNWSADDDGGDPTPHNPGDTLILQGMNAYGGIQPLDPVSLTYVNSGTLQASVDSKWYNYFADILDEKVNDSEGTWEHDGYEERLFWVGDLSNFINS